MQTAALQDATAQAASARSRLYLLLACVFAFPDEEIHESIRDGSLACSIEQLCAQLPYRFAAADLSALESADQPYADFESEYIRLFDVGAAGPPCPLYGGVYIGDRMKVMEDAVRFYNFFGLHLSPEMRELPDHVTTELEFLHYLTFREAGARENGEDPSSLLRAERDFLARHLCRWVPRMQERLAKQDTCLFYKGLVEFAAAFFESDQRYAAASTK